MSFRPSPRLHFRPLSTPGLRFSLWQSSSFRFSISPAGMEHAKVTELPTFANSVQLSLSFFVQSSIFIFNLQVFRIFIFL